MLSAPLEEAFISGGSGSGKASDVASPQGVTTAAASAQAGLGDLTSAIIRRFGTSARLENTVLPTLGGSNRTVIFDLVQGGSRRRMVSRQATYAGQDSPFLPAEQQFRVMRAAFDQHFPVPEPILLFDEADGLGEGFVTAFVSGETMPKRIISGAELAAVRPGLARQAGELLGQLHSMDLRSLDWLAATADSVDPVAAQRRRYDLYDEPHPALELGFRWLELNRPELPRNVLVHGDFRTGNLMVGAGGIQAVLDWECSHLGEGAEDLGWLCTRSWRFERPDLPVGGFGELTPFLRAYAAAGGRQVTEEEIRFWGIFGLVRWGVLNMMQAHGHVFEGRRDVTFAACGRNTSLIEYDLLMTLRGSFR